MAYLQVDFNSGILGRGTSMNVLLPQRSRSMVRDDPDGRYHVPVLFLLHGMSDNHTSWMRWTNIERYAEKAEIAVVMPNADLSWYADMAVGRAYRTFIGRELVETVRAMFPVISPRYEDTWIAGCSMGGYGCMSVGLTYPETFSKIAPISGALLPLQLAEGGESYGYCGRPNRFWEDIFGDLTAFDGSKNDLLALARDIVSKGRPMPKIYQTVGTADFLYKDNAAMHTALREIGMDVTYEEFPDAYHDWHFWDEFIKPVLRWLTNKKREVM